MHLYERKDAEEDEDDEEDKSYPLVKFIQYFVINFILWKWLSSDESFQEIKVREVIIVKEVKRSDGWWRTLITILICFFIEDFKLNQPPQFFMMGRWWFIPTYCQVFEGMS